MLGMGPNWKRKGTVMKDMGFCYMVAGVKPDGRCYALCYEKVINTKTGKPRRKYFWKPGRIKVGEHLDQRELDALVRECRYRARKVEVSLRRAPYAPDADVELDHVAEWWAM
jgi:hypothetical protein